MSESEIREKEERGGRVDGDGGVVWGKEVDVCFGKRRGEGVGCVDFFSLRSPPAGRAMG